MSSSLAPIAYFAFNRPEHTLKSLIAIKKNLLSAETDIYIFCDGPRINETESGIKSIEAVRAIAASELWAKKVTLKFRERNVGLFESITSGITEVIEKYGRVIVIEDDVIISPGFLKFMNESLEMYDNDNRVMHISGYCPFQSFPIKYSEETFFYNNTYCWGWSTWKRAWKYFIADGYELMKRIDKSKRRAYINLDNTFEFYWGLKYIHERKFQDWNYNWHVSVALQNGYCLHPVKTLTNNIGFDGSGTHCTTNEPQKIHEFTENINVKLIPVEENKDIRTILHKRSLKAKLVFLFKHWGRTLFFAFKK